MNQHNLFILLRVVYLDIKLSLKFGPSVPKHMIPSLKSNHRWFYLVVNFFVRFASKKVFTVISLEHLLGSTSKALQVLILAPTREVAIQICDVIKSISVNFSSPVKCSAFIGGQSVKNDKTKLKTCQIAVGTPGRILHLMKDNTLNATNIRLFIMDEADKLLASEFQENIK